MGIKHLIAALSIVAASSAAQALPISYPDGWMVMQNNNFASNSLAASYSFTAKDAVGLRTEYMRNEGDHLNLVTYNRLLARWNEPGARSNIYLLTGAGTASNDGDTRAAATIGIEADYETRRVLVSYENRGIIAPGINNSFSQTGRIGLAPYAGDYEGVATWLIMQVDHRPAQKDPFTVTPLVRLFTAEVLGEAGISSNKDILFNLSLQF